MIDDEFRRHLAALCREYDKFSAECDEFTRQRTPPASPSVSETVIYPEFTGNAPVALPEASDDAPCFTEDQFEALAFAINELRKEWYGELRRQWQEDIERLQQRLLTTITRLVLPGEMAEQKIFGLNDRLAIMERQLSQAIERQPTGDVRKELRKELAELQRRLDKRDERDQVTIERSGRIAELTRENAIARHEAERNEFDKVLAGYRARIEQLETKLGMLLKFIGGDLPRGWGRDDT